MCAAVVILGTGRRGGVPGEGGVPLPLRSNASGELGISCGEELECAAYEGSSRKEPALGMTPRVGVLPLGAALTLLPPLLDRGLGMRGLLLAGAGLGAR